MNIKTMVLLFVFFSFTIARKREIQTYKDARIHAQWEEKQGQMDGLYTSWHPNGVKKSEGVVSWGYRIGKWSVWDSLGQLRHERFYHSPLEFETKYPLPSPSSTLQLLQQADYRIHRDSSGKMDRYYINENEVMLSVRERRRINKAQNNLLFQGDSLSRIILELVALDSIQTYDPTNLEFEREIDYSEEEKAHQVIAFEIKEDWIFDIHRMVSEYRIIGICPIISDGKGSERKLFWIYYPELSNHLYKKKTPLMRGTPRYIQNYDDVFFFRRFTASVTHALLEEGNLDLMMQQWEQGIDSDYAEVYILEREHDLWIEYHTPYTKE